MLVTNENNAFVSGGYFLQPNSLSNIAEGSAYAYSFRKLRVDYKGNSFRVRRNSDNSETDIGFNFLGELDLASYTTFIASTFGYVVKMYDQSGNNRDATQPTAGNQPLLEVDSANGKLAVNFNRTVTTGGRCYLIMPWSTVFETSTDDFEFRSIFRVKTPANRQIPFRQTDGVFNDSLRFNLNSFIDCNPDNIVTYYRVNGVTEGGVSTNNYLESNNGRSQLYKLKKEATTGTAFRNGILRQNTVVDYTLERSNTGQVFNVWFGVNGSFSSIFQFTGNMQETIMFKNLLTPTKTNLADIEQLNYYKVLF